MVSLVFSFINWKILISLIIIIFGLGYGTFYLINSGFFNKDLSPETKRQPTGMLYASLAKLADPVGIMSFDLSSTTQTEFEPFINYPASTVMQFHTTIDYGSGVAGLMAVTTVTEDFVTSNIMAILPDDTISTVLPDDTNLAQIQHLTYSEDSNWLAFSAKDISVLTDSEASEIASVGARQVYLASPAKKEVWSIAPGSAPAWSPDGTSLIYLGETSIMQYDLETTNSSAIDFGAEGTYFGENMNLAVTDDGTKVAITSPNQAALYVGDVTSWTPFTITNLRQVNPHKSGEFPKAYYWPVFSPDGEFLAVQTADIKNSDEQQNQRMSIIDLLTDEVVRTISIAGYDFRRAFLDEWDY